MDNISKDFDFQSVTEPKKRHVFKSWEVTLDHIN